MLYTSKWKTILKYNFSMQILWDPYPHYVKRPCNEDHCKPHFLKRKVGFTGVYLNFLIYDSNIDFCGSLELPGGSKEPQTFMFGT